MVIVGDYTIALRALILAIALAEVREDGLYQIGGAAVMHEKDSLAQSPKRRRTEFVAFGNSLTDVVRKVRTHVVQQQIRIQVRLDIAERADGRLSRLHRRGVAQGTANLDEDLLSMPG